MCLHREMCLHELSSCSPSPSGQKARTLSHVPERDQRRHSILYNSMQ